MKKELKKRGFTLIEVLGVIVVLSVIALITTPIIINVIEKAKKGALEDSAYGLLDSANIYYASGILDETQAKTEFTFSDGMQTSENKLSYKGKVEKGSVRLYNDGKTALCITGGEYAALKNVNDKKVSVTRGRCSYNSETEEYETVGLCQDLQDEIDVLKKKHQEELDKLKEEYEEKLKQAGADKEQLIKDHEDKIKTLTEAYEAQIKELNNQLNVFKNGGTATADQILAGKTAFVKGQLISGTMTSYANQNLNRSRLAITSLIYTNGGAPDTIIAPHLIIQTTLGATSYANDKIYNGYINGTTKITMNLWGIRPDTVKYGQVFGVGNGGVEGVNNLTGTYTSDANATEAGILAGQTAYVKGEKITGTIPSKGATTYTPGTSNQTIASGQYLSGVQTIKGDSNLKAENIKKGTTIFGITGTHVGTDNIANGGIHITVSPTSMCGYDWSYQHNIAIGTYIVTNVMTNPVGVSTASAMTIYTGNGVSTATQLSADFSNGTVVQTYKVVVTSAISSGVSGGRMSNCSYNNSSSSSRLYGKSTWTKIN